MATMDNVGGIVGDFIRESSWGWVGRNMQRAMGDNPWQLIELTNSSTNHVQFRLGLLELLDKVDFYTTTVQYSFICNIS